MIKNQNEIYLLLHNLTINVFSMIKYIIKIIVNNIFYFDILLINCGK